MTCNKHDSLRFFSTKRGQSVHDVPCKVELMVSFRIKTGVDIQTPYGWLSRYPVTHVTPRSSTKAATLSLLTPLPSTFPVPRYLIAFDLLPTYFIAKGSWISRTVFRNGLDIRTRAHFCLNALSRKGKSAKFARGK